MNDPLRHLDEDSDSDQEMEDDDNEWDGIEKEEEEAEEKTELVKELEEAGNRPVVKKPRHQSGREREWLERLIEKYGDDVEAMEWDGKLNPMQQTAADIRKRMRKTERGR